MAFFAKTTINQVKADPDRFDDVYAATRSQFVKWLGSKFGKLPEDYIKLIYSAMFAYESASYGPSSSKTLEGLLHEPTLMCTSYCDLAWLLYEKLNPSAQSNVAHVGWTASPFGGHAQMLISQPGQKALMIDPTVMLLVLNDGLNSLTTGQGIPIQDQLSLAWRTNALTPSGANVEGFAVRVQDAYLEGNLRAGHLQYWYEYSDTVGRYGGSSYLIPLPGAEISSFGFAASNNKTLPYYDDFNQFIGNAGANYTVKGGSSDWIFGMAGRDILFGGASRDEIGYVTPMGRDKARGSSFISATDLARVRADVTLVDDLYAKYKNVFQTFMGTSLSQLPETYIKLAFASTLVYDLMPVGSTRAYSLEDALAASDLDSQSLATLAWRFFRLLTPNEDYSKSTSGPEVSMIGWHGGPTGSHAQLIISMKGQKSLVVDPMVGHVAVVSSFNSMAAGESLTNAYQRSTYWRGDLDAVREKIIDGFDEGLYRAGNLLFWMETPDDPERFEKIPHWATPQGEVYRDGAAPSDVLGGVEAVDRIDGGAGADLLAGDGVGNFDGAWLVANPGLKGWHVGDFDGDGRDDLLRHIDSTDQNQVYRSTGEKFVSRGSWLVAEPSLVPWYVGDFNGDGMDDILRYAGGGAGAQVFTSTGTSFASAGTWSGWGVGHHRIWYVGDFDGDGKDDLGRYVSSVGFEVSLSDGARFADPVTWTGAQSTTPFYVGDFNGDGKDDIARYTATTRKTEVFLSTGTGFASAGVWSTLPTGNGRWIVQDVDGDGKDDLIGDPYLYDEVSVVLQSTGSRFALAKEWLPANAQHDPVRFGDFDGDGFVDFLTMNQKTKVEDVYLGTGTATMDEDYFILRAGEVSGDVILDFDGAGKMGGDILVLEGYNRAQITITNVGDLWTIANPTTGASESFRLFGVRALGSDDILFM